MRDIVTESVRKPGIFAWWREEDVEEEGRKEELGKDRE